MSMYLVVFFIFFYSKSADV